jgi:hypothetical protein
MNMTTEKEALWDLLEPALSRAPVRAWMTDEDRTDARHSILLGRLLRAGDLVQSERAALDALQKGAERERAYWKESARIGMDLVGRLEAATDAGRCGVQEVRTRDDVESVLWVLGRVALSGDEGAAEDERSLVARAKSFDRKIVAEACDTNAAVAELQASNNAWLVRIAQIERSCWWLDLVRLSAFRRTVGQPDLRTPTDSDATPPLRLNRAGLGMRPLESLAAAEVVGCEEDPAEQAIEHGSVVARLCDDHIEVYAVGLGAGAPLPPGLCVRHRFGGAAGIVSVTISAGSKMVTAVKWATGFWTPLSAVTDGVTNARLSVRHLLQGPEREDVLDIVIEGGPGGDTERGERQ